MTPVLTTHDVALLDSPESRLAVDNLMSDHGPVLRQANNENGENLNELFGRNRDRLYKTALRLMGNPEDAEDALQDGLLSAVRNLHQFEGRCQFSTWLTRIVVNAALMRLRWLRSRQMISLDHRLEGDDLPLALRICDPGPNPEEMCARRQRVEMLGGFLRSLPAPYQRAVSLCDIQGLSTKEAAAALGVPTGSLKSRLHRAKLRLRKKAAGHPLSVHRKADMTDR